MKKTIAAAIVMVALTGCTQKDFEHITKQVSQPVPNDYTNPPSYLDSACKSNAAVFYPECNAGNQSRTSNPNPVEYTCIGTVTNEETGQHRRNQSVRAAKNDLLQVKGDERIYHEEDDTGASTLIINTKTGRGDYNLMNESKVVATGIMKCTKR
ncbi:putative periplasmic lipoprotein [Escherichia fergusonii]|uniref:hypothetical protein n=1 Tax=Escherichia fergusonii TaxID=564 RepID=UPI001CBB6A81|nr:hypothetical protein [Escherichia fergusonii]UAT38698.1 hypothetical protein KYC43_15610 [Escherichia fergusonii]HAW1366251.1 hypothetical protein [Escherichia coli]HCJ9228003.1 hypothetical protein [Escherichia coli]